MQITATTMLTVIPIIMLILITIPHPIIPTTIMPNQKNRRNKIILLNLLVSTQNFWPT